MGERELAVRNLDRNFAGASPDSSRAYWIANGTYGVCLNCEQDISSKRIAAVLWAAFCVKCQGRIDPSEIEADENVELLGPAA